MTTDQLESGRSYYKGNSSNDLPEPTLTLDTGRGSRITGGKDILRPLEYWSHKNFPLTPQKVQPTPLEVIQAEKPGTGRKFSYVVLPPGLGYTFEPQNGDLEKENYVNVEAKVSETQAVGDPLGGGVGALHDLAKVNVTGDGALQDAGGLPAFVPGPTGSLGTATPAAASGFGEGIPFIFGTGLPNRTNTRNNSTSVIVHPSAIEPTGAAIDADDPEIIDAAEPAGKKRKKNKAPRTPEETTAPQCANEPGC